MTGSIAKSMSMVLLLVCLFGCPNPREKKPDQVALPKTKNAAELKKAINDALQPKPDTIELDTVKLDAGKPGDKLETPVELFRVELTYTGENSLGYEWLKIGSLHRVVKQADPRLTMMATFKKGENEQKIIALGFGPSGKTTDRRPFEDDKEKLAAVEKRCMNVKEVLEKTLPIESGDRE